MKRAPTPTHPDLVRRPQAPFGWLEAHLLHDHWLERLQPDATAVLLLLALAADPRGASYYSQARMAGSLGVDLGRIDRALDRLLELGRGRGSSSGQQASNGRGPGAQGITKGGA